MLWLHSTNYGQALGKTLLTDSNAHLTSWLVQLSRCQVKQAIALLNGHSHFRKHLHTLAIINDGQECRLCKHCVETAKHIILGCEGHGQGEGLCLVCSTQVMNKMRVLGVVVVGRKALDHVKVTGIDLPT